MTPPGSATAEQRRLDQQQRFIELAISGKQGWRPTAAVVPRGNGHRVQPVAEQQVILSAHKRDKRFESAVSVSALREAIYQMERHGWTVVVGEEHSAPGKSWPGMPLPVCETRVASKSLGESTRGTGSA